MTEILLHRPDRRIVSGGVLFKKTLIESVKGKAAALIGAIAHRQF